MFANLPFISKWTIVVLQTYVADVGLVLLDQLNGKLVQLLEVGRRVGDLAGGESEPLDNLQDGGKVSLLFSLRVGVVVSQVADTVVSLSESKVDVNGLGVSNVQETVGLWREAGNVLAAGGLQVLDHQLGLDLGVASRNVQLGELALKEHIWCLGGGGLLDLLFLLDLGLSLLFLIDIHMQDKENRKGMHVRVAVSR